MLNSVSIIIPTYNGKKFIEETIDSCLNQSYQSIEVIVIDDCSTDGTRELLLNYEGKIKLIFNDENIGIVKNVNQGVNSIDSDFFILLGHDDLLPVKHIELMVSELDNNTASIHCNSMLINAFGDENGFSRDDTKQKIKTEKCLFELSLDNFISSCGMLHRTSVFKAVGGWDDKYLHYGEWLYYIKSLEYGEIRYTTKSYAYYRRHDTNITNTFLNENILYTLNVYKRTCRRLAHARNENSFFDLLVYRLTLIEKYLKFKVRKLKCIIKR